MLFEWLEDILKWGLTGSIMKRQWDKRNKQVADDVALAVQKAHLGKLPRGVYCDQIIWTKKMTREQLCVPLDEETLKRMAECTVVRHHGVECTGVGAKLEDFGNNGTVTLTVSIHFDGETADGRQVVVDVRKALLSGSLVRDKMTAWTLTDLRHIDVDGKPLA